MSLFFITFDIMTHKGVTMSFQAYIENITKITGKKPEDIYHDALTSKVINDTITATLWIDWLSKTYGLGRGHSMALWKYFIEKNWIVPKKSMIKKNT